MTDEKQRRQDDEDREFTEPEHGGGDFLDLEIQDSED